MNFLTLSFSTSNFLGLYLIFNLFLIIVLEGDIYYSSSELSTSSYAPPLFVSKHSLILSISCLQLDIEKFYFKIEEEVSSLKIRYFIKSIEAKAVAYPISIKSLTSNFLFSFPRP